MILTPNGELSSTKLKNKYRVIIYIDGFNLYFGIRREATKRGTRAEPDPRWYRYLWLDLWKLSERLLTPQQELVAVKYFTAPVTGSKEKEARQNAFLDALRTLPKVEIIFGRYQPDPKQCHKCGHVGYHPQEKKTDVNIAVNLIVDSLENNYDTAIVITGDSDLVPALDAVRMLKPEKRLVIAFPPNRYSKELEDATHGKPIRLWETVLRQSRFPNVIKRQGLPDLMCPRKYSGEQGCTVGPSAGDADEI